MRTLARGVEKGAGSPKWQIKTLAGESASHLTGALTCYFRTRRPTERAVRPEDLPEVGNRTAQTCAHSTAPM